MNESLTFLYEAHSHIIMFLGFLEALKKKPNNNNTMSSINDFETQNRNARNFIQKKNKIIQVLPKSSEYFQFSREENISLIHQAFDWN